MCSTGSGNKAADIIRNLAKLISGDPGTAFSEIVNKLVN
jgi:hypothetical protein